MKYSIILAYIDRLPQWEKAVKAWQAIGAGRDDWELVLTIDAKVTQCQRQAAIDAADGCRLVVVDLPPESREWRNMASAVNYGVRAATGTHVILTHQEMLPLTDAFQWFDAAFATKPDAYFAGACLSLTDDGKPDVWYQHSALSHDHRFHFCACCSVETFWKAGGFDDEFTLGYAVEDSEWRDRLEYAGIAVLPYDTVVVAHQAHSRNYQGMDSAAQIKLHARNQAILERNRAARKAGTWKP